jgi:hypothetical protein
MTLTFNKIDAEVTQETETQVIQGVRDVQSLLDFLIALPDDEKKRLAKSSGRYLEFIDRFRIHAGKFPNYLQHITLEDFDKDKDARDSLRRISAELDSFNQYIKDTILVISSEMYQAARVYYKSVKAAAAEGDEDAERIAKDLYYSYMKKRSKDENDANNQETTQQTG